LLNRLLKGAHGRRIAVVENEFGPGLDIESLIARDGLQDYQNEQQLLQEEALEQGASAPGAPGGREAAARGGKLTRLVELSNGCICCSVKDGLVAALEMLVARQPKGQPLHHIVVRRAGESGDASGGCAAWDAPRRCLSLGPCPNSGRGGSIATTRKG